MTQIIVHSTQRHVVVSQQTRGVNVIIHTLERRQMNSATKTPIDSVTPCNVQLAK